MFQELKVIPRFFFPDLLWWILIGYTCIPYVWTNPGTHRGPTTWFNSDPPFFSYYFPVHIRQKLECSSAKLDDKRTNTCCISLLHTIAIAYTFGVGKLARRGLKYGFFNGIWWHIFHFNLKGNYPLVISSMVCCFLNVWMILNDVPI